MHLISRYLLICGLLAHVVVASVMIHYHYTGLNPHYYVTKAVEFLDRDSSPTRHVARFLRLALLDSGLIFDPVAQFPPDLSIEPPRWAGLGASALRRDTAPRYTFDGEGIASTDHDLWVLNSPAKLRSVSVDSVEQLEQAIRRSRPGDEIVLQPGRYRIRHPIELATEATAGSPLVLRGANIGSTEVELTANGRLEVNGGYWTISDLIVRGNCGPQPCTNFVGSGPGANALTLRNIFISDVDSLIATSGEGKPRVAGLVDGVTLVGTNLSSGNLRLREHSVRRIAIPAPDAGGLVTVCPQADEQPGCDTSSLSDAVGRSREGGLILLRTGTYRQATVLNTRGIHLLAEPGAKLYGESVQGKGALVVKADVTIEGLECSHIRVSDGNGCCVRQDRGDITLIGVHFHHAQMGVLTGHEGGDIQIFDSYFHDSGYDESGQLGHNLYINSGRLEFVRSWSLAARNAGHELKSRASSTVVRDSLLASLNARDSRLIDVPNGGILHISGSILGEGPRSENWDLIGYGLEIGDNSAKHPANEIVVRNNTIYVDRPQSGMLLSAKHAEAIDFVDNVIVGNTQAPDGNTHFDDREAAGVEPYPALTALSFN